MRTTQKRDEMVARVRSACRTLYLSGAVGDLCGEGGTVQQVRFLLPRDEIL